MPGLLAHSLTHLMLNASPEMKEEPRTDERALVGVFSRDLLPPARPQRWQLGTGIALTALGILSTALAVQQFRLDDACRPNSFYGDYCTDAPRRAGIALATLGALHLAAGAGLLVTWGVRYNRHRRWVWSASLYPSLGAGSVSAGLMLRL